MRRLSGEEAAGVVKQAGGELLDHQHPDQPTDDRRHLVADERTDHHTERGPRCRAHGQTNAGAGIGAGQAERGPSCPATTTATPTMTA